MGFGGNGFVWILLFAIIFGFGGGGFFGGGAKGTPVTESDLCSANNFAALQNSVGRQADQLNNVYMGLQNGLSNIGYENLRNTSALSQQMDNRFAAQAQAMSEYCCTTQRGIDAVNYNVANQAAAINANVDNKIQQVLDTLCQNKIDTLQSQLNQMQLQNALCGVVRYPQYVTTANPFCGGVGGYVCGSYNI